MLNVDHLSKTFNPGTVNEKLALDDVCLHLAPGDFATVIGGNGAGKSTLLNCVAGVYRQDQGSIRVNGMMLDRLPEYKRARHLGRVFQDPLMGTAADMEIEENLALALRRGKRRTLAWGVTPQERERYHGMLKSLGLGLEDRMSQKVGLLSGGQRQALTLLMATIGTPKVLLLDEHAAALDPKTARKVMELSNQFIKDMGLTCLMVTHNMRHAIQYGNRLIMMSQGRVILDAAGEEKQKLTVEGLIQRFSQQRSDEVMNDRMLLG
ncbi:MAG: ATP-binding cassette domain-containing protein [Clostridiales bacterium]|jgi:putative ABC transport system ATP-binding protein|nr:ATP-binding cassette domain-containing protein [Clostridiales bacterium]